MAKKGKYVYQWSRPMVTVDAAVFCVNDDSAELLLIKRGRDPFKGTWALPGGFIEEDEDLPDSAKRELLEETGLMIDNLRQFGTFGRPGRDPRGRVISVVFTAVIEVKPADLAAGDDAAEAKWFDVNNLPKMAFDHDKIAAAAISDVLN